jgi:hypothetical protein
MPAKRVQPLSLDGSRYCFAAPELNWLIERSAAVILCSG